jgi:hypothetical protein
MRDKHIAHSVNPFETVMLGGMVERQEGQDEPFVAVGMTIVRGLFVGSADAIACRELVRRLLQHVNTEIAELIEKVQTALKAEDPEAFAARQPKTYEVPGPDKAGVARSFGRGSR